MISHPHISKIIYDFRGPTKTAKLLDVYNAGLLHRMKLRDRRWYGTLNFHGRQCALQLDRPGREMHNKIVSTRMFVYWPHTPYGKPKVPARALVKPYITVGDIVSFIGRVESTARFLPSNTWFGEPDRSHIFFEGLRLVPMTVEPYVSFEAYWGS